MARDRAPRHGRRWLLAFAAIVVSARVLHAALPTGSDTSGRTSLAGELLIASPQMRGPPFAHSVILVAQHNRDHALGIIINRPIGRRPVAELLAAAGVDGAGVAGDVPVFDGGPVSPEIGFVIHSTDYHRADTLDIDGRVALTIGVDVLRDIGLGHGPRRSLLAFGYAGWGAQQLDDEVARGDWYTMIEDPALVFDVDRSKLWAEAMARRNAGRQ